MRQVKIKNTGNGIRIKTNKRITLSNKIQISPLLILIRYLISVMGIYGTVFSFISGFDIVVDEGALLGWTLIITIYFHVILRNSRLIKICIFPTMILYLISGYKFFTEIKNGFWHIENYYIQKYNEYFGTNIYNYIVDDLEPNYVLTVFFIFITFIISYLISSVILYNIFRTLYACITMPIVFLIFTVGYIPDAKSFGAYLLCSVFVVGMGMPMISNSKPKLSRSNIKRKQVQDPDKSNLERKFKYMVGLKIGGTCTTILLFLLLIASILFTPKAYNKYVNIKETKAKIQNEMLTFSLDKATDKLTFLDMSYFEIFPSKSGKAGISGGKLGNLSSVTYDYKTVLEIQMPNIVNSLYLKGFVGSDYDGDSWNPLKKESQKQYEQIAKLWEETDFSIMNQSSYLLSIINELEDKSLNSLQYSIGKIKVDYKRNQNYIFSPYYSEYPVGSKFNVKGQEYITSKKKQQSYEFRFYNAYDDMLKNNARYEYEKYLSYYGIVDNGLKIESEPTALQKLYLYADYETTYSDFVYNNYIAVPDTLKSRFNKEFFGGIKYDYYRDRMGDEALTYLVDIVQNYLESNTSYSLSPGALPDNADFVEYFLYENKVGYCTHYASAAAMILRYFGVPVRYVEGYVVKESDINKGTENGITTVKGRIEGEAQDYEVSYLTVEVPDANAHAWTEVYVDGFGWVPVEFTPGYIGIGNNTSLIKELNNSNKDANSTRDLNEELSKNVNDSENANEKDMENKTTPTPKPEENSDDNEEGGLGTYIGGEGNDSGFYRKLSELMRYFMYLFGLSIFIIGLRFLIIHVKRAMDYNTNDFSKKVILRFKELKRILTYYQIAFDDHLTYDLSAQVIEEKLRFIPEGKMVRFIHIVLKAKFDQRIISEAESNDAEEFYRYFIEYLYKDSTFIKKLYMKFIKVI
jgi:transglutaminase-like putative cysteine protease